VYSRIYFTKGTEFSYSVDWSGFDQLAKADLEQALKIDPNLPEVKYEQAELLYRIDRKHEKALELLDDVKTQMPNNPLFYALRSSILRRKGSWKEALDDHHKRILLDPLNAAGYIEIGHTCRLLRRYPEALEFFNKSLLLDQNYENINAIYQTILLWKGDLKEAQDVLKSSNSDLRASVELLDAYFNRQYDKLIPIANKYEDQFDYIPKMLELERAYFLNSNISMTGKYADSAIAELNIKIKESPMDDRYYAALGYAYAYKGENNKAIENAKKAVKLKPFKLDAWQGYLKELDLVKIYVLAGEYDLAMDKIEYLLTIPGDLSVPLLKIDPAYDSLNGLPRFQKILMTEYKTQY
jgi:tetratricopeptide (TPR) repeat protein